MRRNVIETIMAAVVLVVAVGFLVYAYGRSGVSRVGGYDVIVTFNTVDGLAAGSDVRISGIKIGAVVDRQLDPATYLATVRLEIARDVKLPTDTLARIQGDGLLSTNYVVLCPGAAETYIEDGGEIVHSQGPVNLVDEIGRAIYGSVQDAPGGSTATLDASSLSNPCPAKSGTQS